MERNVVDDQDLHARCLEPGRLLPLETATDRRRFAEDFRELARTQLQAASHLLGTNAEQMVVGHAYGAMEAKANELLALRGFRSKSHVCTQMALSRLLDRRDLARTLSRVYEDRQIHEYTSDPRDMRSADSFASLLDLAAEYMEEVQAAIQELDA